MASQKTNNIPKGDHVNVHKPQQGPGRHLSPGVHDPTTPYVPSNPLAWGPKGEWGPKKSAEALNYEAQYAATKSYYTQGGAASRDATGDLGARAASQLTQPRPRRAGFINDQYTWEARGKQEEATFRPNPRNIAPRPKAWKPAEPISY